MIAGVAGGIAEYLDLDPTIVRIIFVLLFVLGIGFSWPLVYLLLWILMPEAPADAAAGATPDGDRGAEPGLIFGVLLIGLGVLFLANQFAPVRFGGFGAARAAWPLLLIAAGAMIFLAARDQQRR